MPLAAWSATSENYILRDTSHWVYLALAGVVIFAALMSLYNVMIMYFNNRAEDMLREQGKLVETAPVKKQSLWDRFYKQATQYVPMDKEKDILLDHNYDGIQELDNNLPPWWLWMFYISIAFSVFYIWYFHFSPWQYGQIEEYQRDMAKAELQVKEYMALRGSSLDENNLSLIEDEATLALAEANFINNCAACHKNDGGGSVGPNLTDEYWVHGGDIHDIYKTIKYGVPEKGMIAWKAQLRPDQMHQLASYILTLQGTNPPGAKAPEGEKYIVETTE